MSFRQAETPSIAAAKAGFSIATAYRIEQDPRLSSQKKAPRGRRRRDPLSAVWDSEVVPLLKSVPGLRPVAIFDEIRRRHPEIGAGVSGALTAVVQQLTSLENPRQEDRGGRTGDIAQQIGAENRPDVIAIACARHFKLTIPVGRVR